MSQLPQVGYGLFSYLVLACVSAVVGYYFARKRTEYEVGNPAAVLDGDIDGFLEAGIRWRNRKDDN